MIGIIDLIVLGIVVISVLFALYRGLVRELLGISSWLLAGFAALYSFDPFMKSLDGHFQNVKLAAIISSVVLALIVLILMTIINAAITRRLRKSSLSGLDRIFGLVFGVARALLIVALIYIFSAAIVLSPKQINMMKEQNRVTVEEFAMIDTERLKRAIEGGAFDELKGKTLYREQAFTVNIPASRLFDTKEDEQVLLQGVIDLLAVKGDSAEIIDYKYSVLDPESLLKKYAEQLNLYAYAAEKVLGLKVVRKTLVNIFTGETVRVE